MESMAVDVNGGNAEMARDEPNLEVNETPINVTNNERNEQIADDTMIASVKMEEESEINGDVKITKKKTTPLVRKKLRKFKANNPTSNADNNEAKNHTSPRGLKRKFSEPDDLSSEDSTEFNGFDNQLVNNIEPGSQVLQKLIAEAELAETPPLKRNRRSTYKGFANMKNNDEKDDTAEMDDYKEDNSRSPFGHRFKKEKESDTDSIGIPISLESETDIIKTEESSIKSTNSSANSSPSGIRPKLKIGKIIRGVSPGSGTKQKVAIDMTNPLFREPFKYGWKRELVFRAGSDQHTARRMADIYYYTPKGKKVRSFREVAEFLVTKELTIDNFTFFKEPLGVNNPDYEIIRDARVRDSTGPVSTPPKKYMTPKKLPPKRIVEKPLTPPPPAKVAAKSPKVASAGFKIKLPGKKGQQKKEVKSPAKEPSMLPPQWSSPPMTRRSQPIVEKTPPVKPKRIVKAKLQEPCSIRCASSVGLIPSLQCSLCLCLYHPECVDATDIQPANEYVCKNCHEDTKKSDESEIVPLPPPLIPISMMSAQSPMNGQLSVEEPPKLQKIKQSIKVSKSPQKIGKKSQLLQSSGSKIASPNISKKDSGWLSGGNEFLRGHDGTMPKPAQNIALMAGKRYIVVPKNNAMAVQPAITVRNEKMIEKTPIMPEATQADIPAETSRMTSTIFNDFYKTTKNQTVNEPRDQSTANFSESIETVDKIDETLKNDGKNEIHESNETIKNNLVNFMKTSKNKCFMTIEINEDTKKDDVQKLINELTDDDTPIGFHEPKVSVNQLEVSNKEIEVVDNSSNLQMEIISSNCIPVKSKIAVKNLTDIKKPLPLETDPRHFMVSVCAGYHALSRIFQYLKVQELLRAARVCKMWRDLAAHPNLWKTVRMKNSQVTDWDGLADSLKRHGTQHLDLRKMLVAGESDGIWKKFITVIPRVISLVKLELCRCPVMVVEEVIKSCPQLEILSAMSIKCDTLNLDSVGNLKSCQELRLKAISGMSLQGDLTPLQELTQLTHLSLTSVKELGKKNIDILASLINLETLELGECSDFPEKFGTSVLLKLEKLERLRLEKGQGTCCTFDILDGVSKLSLLHQLELVNFDVKNGFDKCLSNCKNIKRLLIIPTYISQSATSNNMVLGGVTELSNNLTHFVWGVTLELLRVTELFVDQCNQMNKQVTGDSIPVLKPVPCLKLIEDVEDESVPFKGDEKPQPNLTNPQVDILPLPQLQKLLLTALPKTRVKILKIPFHATWRQSISDTTTQ